MTKKEKRRPARLLGQALRCAAGALIAGAIGASIGAGPSFPVRDAGFGEWTAILTGASNAQALEPGAVTTTPAAIREKLPRTAVFTTARAATRGASQRTGAAMIGPDATKAVKPKTAAATIEPAAIRAGRPRTAGFTTVRAAIRGKSPKTAESTTARAGIKAASTIDRRR